MAVRPRALGKNAHTVTQVSAQLIEPSQTKRSAHALPVDNGGAKRDAGLASGFDGRMTRTYKIGSKQFNMRRQLSFHLGFKATSMPYGSQPRTHLAKHAENRMTLSHRVLPSHYSLIPVPCRSHILRRGAKNSSDDTSHPIPLLGFGLEPTAACGS